MNIKILLKVKKTITNAIKKGIIQMSMVLRARV